MTKNSIGYKNTVVGLFLVLLGCDRSLQVSNEKSSIASQTEQLYWVEEVATGLDLPRSIAWLSNGDMLVAEWAGKIRILRDGSVIGDILGVPKVYPGQRHGLRDIKLDPDFTNNGFVYLVFVGGVVDELRGNVFRAKLVGDQLTDGKIIFKTSPAMPAGTGALINNMLFLPDKTLLVGVGTGGQKRMMLAQRLDAHMGKIVRIHRDGSAPDDNPFLNTVDALPEIWALGLRNAAGIASMEDGSLWAVDMGPKGGDELNELKSGANYGWPLATWGFDYSGEAMATFTGSVSRQSGTGFIDPALVWVPSHAPSGLLQYRGKAYPFWRGDLFTGGLSGQSLRRIRVRDGKVILQERMLADLNERMRNILLGPDGLLYLLTDAYGKGRVLRLRPGVPPKGAQIAKSLFDSSTSENDRGWKKVTDPYREKYGSLKNYIYDPVNGERKFEQFCSACHSYRTFNSGHIGPNLNGVNGRTAGVLTDFDYSESFSNSDRKIVWNHLTLLSFLDNPRLTFPDTKMSISPLSINVSWDVVNYLTDGELSKAYGDTKLDTDETSTKRY